MPHAGQEEASSHPLNRATSHTHRTQRQRGETISAGAGPMATQDTLSEAGCVLPCFFLLSWLLIKQGGVEGHPQLFRADPCHPFRLPLLHGGEQGWGWDPWPPAPLSLSLCQPGGSSSSSHTDSRCVSALLHFSVDEAKLGAWPGCPCIRWCHQKQ